MDFEQRASDCRDLIVEVIFSVFKINIGKESADEILEWVKYNVEFIDGKLPRPKLVKEKINGHIINISHLYNIILAYEEGRLLINVFFKKSKITLWAYKTITYKENLDIDCFKSIKTAINSRLIKRIIIFSEIAKLQKEIERKEKIYFGSFQKISSDKYDDIIRIYIMDGLLLVYIKDTERNNYRYSYESYKKKIEA